MIKRILILAITMIFISVSSSFALINKKEIVEEIITSIETHPELWVDTGFYLVYLSDSVKVKKAKKRLYPELDEAAEIVLIYNLFRHNGGYITIKKPLKYDIEGKLKEQLMIQIKLYKLKTLTKEVGYLLKKPKKKIIAEHEVKKEQNNKENMKKL